MRDDGQAELGRHRAGCGAVGDMGRRRRPERRRTSRIRSLARQRHPVQRCTAASQSGLAAAVPVRAGGPGFTGHGSGCRRAGRRLASRIEPRNVLLGIVGTAAASVAGLFVVARRPDLYETAIGEVRRVPLTDRSTMAVNTSSRISVAYTATRRAVSIDHGEAWFQVKRDPARPFVVSVGLVRVEAVGTAFPVRKRNGGAEVMVTEGVVRVWNEENEPGAVRLAAGAGLFVSDTAEMQPSMVRAPAIERRLAWRSGQLNLEGETLAEAVDEFNRFNGTQIVIQDREVADKRLYGVFRLDDPQGVCSDVCRFARSRGMAAERTDHDRQDETLTRLRLTARPAACSSLMIHAAYGGQTLRTAPSMKGRMGASTVAISFPTAAPHDLRWLRRVLRGPMRSGPVHRSVARGRRSRFPRVG